MESDMEPVPCDLTISRRDLLKVGAAARWRPPPPDRRDGADAPGSGRRRATMKVSFDVNGQRERSMSTRAPPCSMRCARTCN
jgi:hypothetical protein